MVVSVVERLVIISVNVLLKSSPRRVQRRVHMLAMAPQSRRCLSSQVTASRTHLLDSLKRKEEMWVPARGKPIRKIEKGLKMMSSQRQQQQSGPKRPASRC